MSVLSIKESHQALGAQCPCHPAPAWTAVMAALPPAPAGAPVLQADFSKNNSQVFFQKFKKKRLNFQ